MAAIATPAAPSGRRFGIRRRRRFKLQLLRAGVFLVLGAFFLLPLLAMLDFTTRAPLGGRTLSAWRSIVSYPDLMSAIMVSLELAVLTSAAMLVLLLPTMVWVRLRLPQLQRPLEFVCLLPLTIPAIVLVVGLVPIYHWVSTVFGDSALTLTFAYVILVLPYAYRTLDAGLSSLDLRTLTEAARSLGASWTAVMLRVILPNMYGAVLNACLLSVALVLGEFTLASLLAFTNLQVSINLLGKADATVSIAVSLASLLFAFMLLLVLSFVGGRRGSAAARGRG